MPGITRAPMLEVEVSEELINEGVVRDSGHCMIAEAVKAAYPAASFVSVDIQTIRFTDKSRGLRFTYLTPRVAQTCLVSFDQGLKPEPFSVRLKGGQVTTSGKSQTRRRKAALEPQLRTAAQQKQTEQAQATAKRLRKATIVEVNENRGEVPDRHGGKTPPLAPLARRRSFGLRSLTL